MIATDKQGNLRRTVGIAFLALSLLALMPVITVRLPPILDYPNHMARMYVLSVFSDMPDLGRYYRIVWKPLPNLAIDAVIPWIARVMPVEIAMRAYMGAMLIAIASGCIALHRAAFRRWSIWPLAVFLLLYNRTLLWGFLNYLTGLAAMLWALAIWIALEKRPTAQRLVIGIGIATTVYFCHLAAFGCYALALAAFSLARPPIESPASGAVHRLALALSTLLPGIVFFLTGPTSDGSPHGGYGNWLRKLDLPVSLFDNYNRIFDGATFGVLLIAVVAGLVRGGISVHPRLRWSVLTLIAVYFVTPTQIFSASAVDHRLPIAIALIFLGGSECRPIGARYRKAIVIGLGLLLLVRMAVVETMWLRADREYDTLRPMIGHIAPNAVVATASPIRSIQAGGIPLYHFPTLAIIDRHAFVDTVFADPKQQPMQLTDRVRAFWAHPVIDIWQRAVNGTLPPMNGYDDLVITDPPDDLDTSKLPGTITFAAPRMLLLHLSHQATGGEAAQ